MNRRILLHTTLIALPLGLAGASTLFSQLLQGVDQAVTDQDRLGMSLRQVESGLGLAGQQSALFLLSPAITPGTAQTPLPPGHLRYLRLDLGLRVTTDRIDYVVRNPEGRGYKLNQAPSRDGEFFELVGPNTVFELHPWWQSTALSPALSPTDPRINAMVDGRLDGRVQP